ncbi:hypothetical protein HDV02_003970 [Globomyces sp. JEL0801]|nr:hypothetical protein HDV02_003970 [Globomyces sp. JEL0801]
MPVELLNEIFMHKWIILHVNADLNFTEEDSSSIVRFVDFGIAKDDRSLGVYVGMLSSVFCVAQLFTSLPWGWVSDRVGRRPVIIIGLLGNAVFCTLFGSSKTFAFAMVMRSLCGFLNGNVGVVKSMIGELTDSSNRGLAFAFWQTAYGLGAIVGPMLGGLLVNPVEQFPGIFGNSQLFKEYPYLLPCLVGSFFSIVGAILGILLLEETLKTKSTRSSISNSTFNEEEMPLLQDECIDIPEENLTFKQTMTKEVQLSILLYGIWCLINIIYEEVYTLFVAEPLSAGGLQFTAFDIGTTLSISGFVELFGQIVIFPMLLKCLSLVNVFRISAALMAIFSIALPFCSDFARSLINTGTSEYTPEQKSAVFWLLFLLLAGKTLASVTGYIPVIMFVNDSAPTSSTLGTVHGCGQMTASFMRGVGPIIGGSLWSWSLSNNLYFPFDHHFTFGVVALLSVLGIVQSYRLEKNLRKQ